jgi:hypothetical protein
MAAQPAAVSSLFPAWVEGMLIWMQFFFF